jgi:hypothetical protein
MTNDLRPQLRAALDLYALSLSVIPLHHPGSPSRMPLNRAGKAPLIEWDVYKSRIATPEELHTWFDIDEPRNFGVVCGRVSGVVVVDCDDDDALQVAEDCLPATPVRTVTSKGAHLFFRYPEDATPGETFGNKTGVYLGGLKYRVDLRGDLGYVVVPPSIHASGVEYTAPEPWVAAFARMPMLAAAELRALYREPARPVAAPRTVTVTSWGDALEQARRYFARVPPAIEGCGGDHHTFVQACRVIRDFGLSESEAYDVLREWNQRCVPPWSERELFAKLQGALKYGNGAIGTKVVVFDRQRRGVAC